MPYLVLGFSEVVVKEGFSCHLNFFFLGLMEYLFYKQIFNNFTSRIMLNISLFCCIIKDCCLSPS